MSADHMSVCPNCATEAINARKELRQELEAVYGEVSSEEYVKMLKRIEYLPDLPKEKRMRQDYEVYVEEETGELHLEWSCYCYDCGFEKKLELKWDVLNLGESGD